MEILVAFKIFKKAFTISVQNLVYFALEYDWHWKYLPS